MNYVKVIINCEKMAITRDANEGHNGVGRPGNCPGTDEAHAGH